MTTKHIDRLCLARATSLVRVGDLSTHTADIVRYLSWLKAPAWLETYHR